MAKIIDITDKLNFDEKPKIAVKGEVYEVNDSAVTMLKVLPELKDTTPESINKVFEMLFSAEDRAKIEKLSLNFVDFSTLVMEAVNAVTGGFDDEGEVPTPATT